MRRLMMMVLVLAALPLGACTYRSIYEGSESWRSEDCDKLDESQRVSCEAQAEMSYEEYQQLREEELRPD
ncbi:hypothetical protein [Abyssibacter sp.]|jgi:hypothetical protein|uniref:hypothetical protein n=1 Tax=Abyssibacter sp. TaxID=2320200 RepID=UPI0025BBDDCB|nr:hypothetical protein [Abyssibacter sp.]MCK5857725.1 hypothetical protein [Abyssibacter sp.]